MLHSMVSVPAPVHLLGSPLQVLTRCEVPPPQVALQADHVDQARHFEPSATHEDEMFKLCKDSGVQY